MDSNRIVVVGRDGVINRYSGDCIRSPEEWEPLPGSLEAIARLCQADYRVVVMTTQPGIAGSILTLNTLNRIHQKMLGQLHALGGEIDAIFFCPHGPEDGCRCRKPLPGLFYELQQRLKCNLHGVDAVGDSLQCLQAARAAQVNPVLVRTGKGLETEAALASGADGDDPGVPEVHDDLAGYVESLRDRGLLVP